MYSSALALSNVDAAVKGSAEAAKMARDKLEVAKEDYKARRRASISFEGKFDKCAWQRLRATVPPPIPQQGSHLPVSAS